MVPTNYIITIPIKSLPHVGDQSINSKAVLLCCFISNAYIQLIVVLDSSTISDSSGGGGGTNMWLDSILIQYLYRKMVLHQVVDDRGSAHSSTYSLVSIICANKKFNFTCPIRSVDPTLPMKKANDYLGVGSGYMVNTFLG